MVIKIDRIYCRKSVKLLWAQTHITHTHTRTILWRQGVHIAHITITTPWDWPKMLFKKKQQQKQNGWQINNNKKTKNSTQQRWECSVRNGERQKKPLVHIRYKSHAKKKKTKYSKSPGNSFFVEISLNFIDFALWRQTCRVVTPQTPTDGSHTSSHSCIELHYGATKPNERNA